jgi:hypothetical protein
MIQLKPTEQANDGGKKQLDAGSVFSLSCCIKIKVFTDKSAIWIIQRESNTNFYCGLCFVVWCVTVSSNYLHIETDPHSVITNQTVHSNKQKENKATNIISTATLLLRLCLKFKKGFR